MPNDPPIHNPEELLGLMPRDLQALIDCREVIARIVDGSRFEEFKARYGTTLICGWASIQGYPVGLIGNNGPLFSESSEKAAQFIQLCNQQNILSSFSKTSLATWSAKTLNIRGSSKTDQK